MKGENERLLFEILNDAFPGEWKQDTPFINGRKFRGDAVNENRKIIIEINGGLNPFYMTLKDGRRVLATKGGHSSVEGIERDYEKSNAAVIAGWKPLTYTSKQLREKPWMIISAVRQLCGYVVEGQQELNLDGLKQATLTQVQVKLS